MPFFCHGTRARGSNHAEKLEKGLMLCRGGCRVAGLVVDNANRNWCIRVERPRQDDSLT